MSLKLLADNHTPEDLSKIINVLQNLKLLIIGLLGASLLRAVNFTLKWETIGLDGDERMWGDKKPTQLILFWHGRLLFIPWIYLKHRSKRSSPAFTALISQHHDGRIIASIVKFLGVKSIAGSSSSGGLRSLYALTRALNGHSHVAITPDGPKGPPRQMKRGALIIAQKSGAKIYPCAIAADRYWKFRSWDGMIFPKPFSRAIMIKGAAISIPKDSTELELAALSHQVETALNNVTIAADCYFQNQAVNLLRHTQE